MTSIKKPFSVAILKIGDEPFAITDFTAIPDKEIDDTVVSGEVHASTKIMKEIKDNKFVLLYFWGGDIFPRPAVVYNRSTHDDEENPRTLDQIERSLQTFVLIDVTTQKIYISDFRKKRTLEDWLNPKIDKTVLIKNIIDKEHFLNEIQSVTKIYLSAAPNLFTSAGILNEALTQDQHNYGAGIKQIGVSIYFEENSVPDKLKRKIMSLFTEQENNAIKKLEVSGRYDDKFERIFNAEGIVDKITVDLTVGEDGMLDKDQVFTALITAIS